MPTKIFTHIPDDWACTIYRANMPMLHCYRDLSLHGIHVTGEKQTLPHEDFDIYIFNRLIRPDFYSKVFVPLSCGTGKKFVWQCDDNLWHIPQWNPAIRLLDETDLASTRQYIDHCSQVWVSTAQLGDFINQPHKTKVLPNLVDLNNFSEETVREEGPVKIVWCGSASHDKDLEVIVEPIVKILEKYNNKVAVIFWGYLPTQLANFERHPGFPHATLVPKYPNLYFGEWFSNREYFHKLAGLKPDIAIMPLDDCIFNYSKSNVKYLEMSMAGAACIATDLPPYECMKHQETGLLVNTDDWYDGLVELIENKEYRLQLNSAAKEQIRAEYCWQSPARNLWLNAYLDLVAS